VSERAREGRSIPGRGGVRPHPTDDARYKEYVCELRATRDLRFTRRSCGYTASSRRPSPGLERKKKKNVFGNNMFRRMVAYNRRRRSRGSNSLGMPRLGRRGSTSRRAHYRDPVSKGMISAARARPMRRSNARAPPVPSYFREASEPPGASRRARRLASSKTSAPRKVSKTRRGADE